MRFGGLGLFFFRLNLAQFRRFPTDLKELKDTAPDDYRYNYRANPTAADDRALVALLPQLERLNIIDLGTWGTRSVLEGFLAARGLDSPPLRLTHLSDCCFFDNQPQHARFFENLVSLRITHLHPVGSLSLPRLEVLYCEGLRARLVLSAPSLRTLTLEIRDYDDSMFVAAKSVVEFSVPATRLQSLSIFGRPVITSFVLENDVSELMRQQIESIELRSSQYYNSDCAPFHWHFKQADYPRLRSLSFTIKSILKLQELEVASDRLEELQFLTTGDVHQNLDKLILETPNLRKLQVAPLQPLVKYLAAQFAENRFPRLETFSVRSL